MLVILVLGAVANQIGRAVVGRDSVVFTGLIKVGSDLTPLSTYYNTSAELSHLPPELADSSGFQHVYVDRMFRPARIAAQWDGSALAPASFGEITFIIGLYGTDFVFFGPPPREFDKHLSGPWCGNAALGPGIDVHGTVGGLNVVLSLGAPRHVVSGSAACGAVDFRFGTASIPLWVDCTDVELGNSTVLSALLLNVGVYVGPSEVCLYRPNNNEIEHATAFAVVTTLVGFLVVWADWTQHLWAVVRKHADAGVWDRIIPYYPVVADIIILVVNLNVFAALKDTHNIYSFTSARIVPVSVLRDTVQWYSFAASPFAGLTCLLALTVGQVLKSPDVDTRAPFSWGIKRLQEEAPIVRAGVTALVLVGLYAGIGLLWHLGVEDLAGSYALAISAVFIVAHRSSPSWITGIIQAYRHQIEPYSSVVLVYLRWSMEFLILTCIQNNLPFDVGGTLSTKFTAWCAFVIGIVIIARTARDVAHVENDLVRSQSWRVFSVVRPFVCAMVVFVIWFCTVFSTGGSLFSNSEALINKEALALRCAIATSSFLYACVYSASSHAGPREVPV